MAVADKRTAVQKRSDKARVTRLHVRGKTQEDIAILTGLSQATVSRTVRSIEKEWQNSPLADLDKARQETLTSLADLRAEYWEAYERSCINSKVAMQRERSAPKTVKNADGESKTVSQVSKELSERREQRDGNPAFLAGVMSCIEKRIKIFGLEAPKRNEVTINDWREEAKDQGYDASELFSELVTTIAAKRAATSADDTPGA